MAATSIGTNVMAAPTPNINNPDVYKRQDRPRLCQPVADYFYGFELVAQQLSRCVGHTERVLRGVKPVSYTHLITG